LTDSDSKFRETTLYSGWNVKERLLIKKVMIYGEMMICLQELILLKKWDGRMAGSSGPM
jgi:hypothetical protein